MAHKIQLEENAIAVFMNDNVAPGKAGTVTITSYSSFVQQVEYIKSYEGCMECEGNQQRTEFDRQFESIINYLESRTENELFFELEDRFHKLSENHKQLLEMYAYWNYAGKLSRAENNFQLLKNRAASLKHTDEIRELYDKLGNHRSKMILVESLKSMVEYTTLEKTYEYIFPDYFDLDVFSFGEEFFVDCGCCDGKDILVYNELCATKAKKFVAYEASPSNAVKCRERLKKIENCEVRNKALADQQGIITLVDTFGGTAHDAGGDGQTMGNLVEVECVTLDEDISEKITFLKMDIEGGELMALTGAKRHISEDKPKLAISIYHKAEDIWQISSLISSFCPDYKFFLQHKGQIFKTSLVAPVELSLLCVVE